MRLCEEYLQRHAIKVPLVKHVTQAATAIFNNGTWLVKSITWNPPEYHPGLYRIETLRICHNGLEQGNQFQHVENLEVQWDEYESFMLSWANGIRVPRTVEEVTIAAWEMFLCWGDRALIPYMHFDRLAASVDTGLSAAERCMHIAACVEHFAKTNRNAHGFWTGDMAFYRENHAQWLADLCKD